MPETGRAGSASADSPLEKVRFACQRWIDARATDWQAWLDIAADDIEFISAADGRDPIGFTRRRDNKQELVDYFTGLQSTLEMIEFEIDEIFGDDSSVVVLSNSLWRVRANGRSVRMRAMMLFTFRDGLVCRFENIYDTEALFEAFRPLANERRSRPIIR